MAYAKGRRIEYRCKDILKKMGVSLVFRSAGSKGPADLIAIFPLRKEIWLIQVKGYSVSKKRLSREYGILKELEGEYVVKAKAFVKRGNRYVFEDLE